MQIKKIKINENIEKLIIVKWKVLRSIYKKKLTTNFLSKQRV